MPKIKFLTTSASRLGTFLAGEIAVLEHKAAKVLVDHGHAEWVGQPPKGNETATNPPSETRSKAQDASPEAVLDELVNKELLEIKDGGWYEFKTQDGIDKVQGKDKAIAKAQELYKELF